VSEEVTARIVGEIRLRGPITFAEFMELALYGPGGFYDRPPVGETGHFVTSPHVHEVFGELLARALRQLWESLGRPSPFAVAEAGAGDGTLARRLLERLGDTSVRYTTVERSAGARDALAAIEGLTVADELSGPHHVVLANELLDNLPFRRTRGSREVRVGLDDGRLVEVETAWSGEPAWESERAPGGEEHVVPVGALGFVDRLASALAVDGGYALLIDYGGVGEAGGPVHGYRGHRVVEDPLEDPGSADITAGVDFSLIARRAETRGLISFPTVTQRQALVSLGFDRWMRAELKRQGELLSERKGTLAVRAWSGRSRASLLVDPGALGRLRWLALATPGLGEPSWLTDARAAPGS
jgi:SAM-dependent MidA family methyltransferase